MSDIKNTDPRALITLGDLSNHFSQGVNGHIMLSDGAKTFILDGLTIPTPTPSTMTGAQIIAALQADATIIEVQDMAGNKIGLAIP